MFFIDHKSSLMWFFLLQKKISNLIKKRLNYNVYCVSIFTVSRQKNKIGTCYMIYVYMKIYKTDAK